MRPNPANDFIIIDLPDNNLSRKFEIINNTGQPIMESNLNQTNTISIKKLLPGMDLISH